MLVNYINFLVESAVSSAGLFIPNLARDLGASQIQVGLIGAAYGLTMFFSFFIFGRLADVWGRRNVIILGLIASAVAFALQILPESPFQLLAVRALVGFSIGIFPAALISHIYDLKKKVGKFSAFGSLGWGAGYFLAGVLIIYWRIFLVGSVFLFIAFIFALKMEAPKISLKAPVFPFEIIKKNFSVYLSFLLRHSSAQMIWIIFPLYLSSLGINKFQIGLLYFTNTFLQFFIMQKIDGVRSQKLVLIGTFLSALTFFSFTLAKNFFQFLPTEVMLAFAWSFFYVGSLKQVLEKNAEKSTAVGLFKSTISLSVIIGPFFGGLASQYLGYIWTINIAAVLTFFTFLYSYFLSLRKMIIK